MNKREIVRQFLIATVIYDSDLSTKVVQALSNDMIEVSPDRYYDIKIVFDRHVYSTADFYRFPLVTEPLRPKGYKPKTKEEKVKQRIYDILSEQLDRVTEVQVERMEDNLQKIVDNFEEMKRDLVFLLKESEGTEGYQLYQAYTESHKVTHRKSVPALRT